MKTWFRSFCLLILIVAVTPAAAALIPPVTIAYGHTNPANGHNYYMLRGADSFEGISWDDAEAVAVGIGGHLVAINDAAEYTWILQNFPGGDLGYLDYYVWIGLNDKAQEGKFRWSNGDGPTFTRWYPGEPNNDLGNEDAVVLFNFTSGQFRWNDAEGNALYGDFPCSAIAEFVPLPEPASLALAVICAAAFARRRRLGN